MMNENTILITVALATGLMVLPKKYSLLPFFVGACFVPADQRVIIAELDFPVLRILVVVGVLRLYLRGEVTKIRWNRFDLLLSLWVVAGAAVYVLQWLDMRALIYKCGILFDVLGFYWLFRQNVRSWSEIKIAVRLAALCALLLAPLVAVEWSTGNNPFVALGRVQTALREGSYRCQASFPHSIMLGLFWATLVPLFVGLAMTEKNRIFYIAAVAAAVFIVFSTASSTPLFSLGAIVLLLPLFAYRRYGRQLVWTLCGLTILLHIVMNAPVWHLVSRVSIVEGSTGWHRYNLINQAVIHFREWAVLGTRSTAHWGWALGDITNQYVAEAANGGVVTLCLFVYLLIVAVRVTGSYSMRPLPKHEQLLTWCVCVSVLGHCLSFLGVGYFGQIRMLLYLIFSFAAAVYEMSNSERRSSAYVKADRMHETNLAPNHANRVVMGFGQRTEGTY